MLTSKPILLVLFTASFLNAQSSSSDPPVLSQLVDKTIDVRLSDGSMIGPVTVTELKEGNLPNSLKSIRVLPLKEKRASNLIATKIDQIFLDGNDVDLSYDKGGRCLVFDAEKRSKRLEHRDAVSERLSVTRDRYWETLTEKEHEEFMVEHRAFIEKTKSAMPSVPFRFVETEFFLFLTDLTPVEVDGYIVYLDAMYAELCKSFGLSPKKNIWAGKCVVIAFRSPQHYHHFEATVMNNRDSQGSQGLCHQYSDGKVVFAGYKGDNGFFGEVLVHETSHGFVHRYMTTASAPSWLNEGMSDWLAAKIVGPKRIVLRQKDSAEFVVAQGGWGDFLTTERITGNHYGAASTLVEILLSLDKKGTKFRQFFIGIKEGKPADQALKESFGISYQDLQILYAQAITKMR